ncbi:MAG TPA: protein kinase [Acidobacteriota bacterium]|nr:protein kinase [Acidobacteriota bacterium]
MIRQSEDFFGRTAEVSRILSRLGADPPQSVSVVGERRIGKSSLLFHLTHGDVLQDAVGASAQPPKVVFLDCQQLQGISVDEFFQLLLRRIERVHADLGPIKGESYNAFRSMLEGLDEDRRRLAVLLDEFDAITSNPTFGPDFYSFLRSMANNYPVAYVTSSKTELQRLCFSQEISDSPFFNIFSNLYLRPFRLFEARDVIVEPSRRQGRPLQPYADRILAMAGRFPLYLQIACSACWEALEAEDDEPDWREVEQRFLEEASPHFDYFWEQAEDDVRRVLSALLAGRQPDPEDRYLCQNLQRRGYLESEEDGGWRLFSGLFQEHLKVAASSSAGGGGSPRAIAADQQLTLLGRGTEINQYRILSKAGEGGMGVIYCAQDSSLDRRVALKFILPQSGDQKASRRRFLQEARAAAALSHPCITSVHELFEYQGQIVMVMEWVEGRSLKEIVGEQGRQDWKPMTEWMIQACRGLQEAHDRGIVHRDVKSSNIMITRQDQVKITDFGLAKHWRGTSEGTGLTQEGALLGTIDYMSPEQAHGDEVDGRSDLFSLGVVYFEGLTGRLPFHRRSPGATLRAIFDEAPPYLGLYDVGSAERIDRILRRLLEKDPDRRYPSADELKKDLRKLLRKRGLLDWLGG